MDDQLISLVKTRISNTRAGLFLRHPFWALLVMGLKEEYTEEVPTMSTDGFSLFINPHWVEKQDDKVLQFAILHEAVHIGLLHPARFHGRIPQIWNLACDHIVNTYLSQEGYQVPPGAVPPGKNLEKTAEEIYEELLQLMKHLELSPQEGIHGDSTTGTSSTTEGADQDTPQDTPEKILQGKPCDLKRSPGEDAEKKLIRKVESARQVAKAAGKVPGIVEQLLDELLRPTLPWRDILRNFIIVASGMATDYRWIPPNKKFLYQGIYLPSTRGEFIEIAVGVDTSGSISDEELVMFLSEITGLCEEFGDYRIHVFFCDATIQDYFELAPGNPLPNKVKGRGGTSFKPVFEAVEKLPNVSALVYLTDLCPNDGFPPEPRIPVIWIATGKAPDPPYGEVIRYER